MTLLYYLTHNCTEYGKIFKYITYLTLSTYKRHSAVCPTGNPVRISLAALQASPSPFFGISCRPIVKVWQVITHQSTFALLDSPTPPPNTPSRPYTGFSNMNPNLLMEPIKLLYFILTIKKYIQEGKHR